MSPKKRIAVLPYVRLAAMALVALLLVAAGARASWGTAQHVLLPKGREHGTLTVTGCGEEVCTGRFVPREPAEPPRTDVTIARSVAVEEDGRYEVVVKPDTAEAVRTGWAGGLYAWLPLGGALLLAAPVLGAGMRRPRTAWVSGAAGGVLLVTSFLVL
ncbi:hypothetical protein M4914_08975 [Streptomyces somaliensis DSM 40738]|uniref:Integral membrane protein n=1 Tax=Streptomyces somaliensis (strain ATCC 33201 / DSM 40738 / JCM 12659 / KCTC 9044 / NCTC 11332 / NRRL B-12077 / IP 733) TaxID=1134445 RepID=A0AA44DE99_STRE0|nr:hypothetical protein [Streptomyces somaliensis]MCQ0023062.1 hypothetical protein [Streptomyces somaliensis DSM 40738]NKY14561.1 hypothetical protein [Streptomyces somaliensis DSM 40738]